MGRMSHRAEWTAFITGKQEKKPPKYGNKKTKEWDSQHEADVGMKLYALERAGKISNLERQVPLVLVQGKGKVRSIKFICDFRFTDEDGIARWMDAKGMRTAIFIIKKKLAYLLHGIDIEEV